MPCAVVVGLLEDEVGFPYSRLHMLGVELGAGAGLPEGGAGSSALIGWRNDFRMLLTSAGG